MRINITSDYVYFDISELISNLISFCEYTLQFILDVCYQAIKVIENYASLQIA